MAVSFADALALHRSGRLAEAEAAYRAVLAVAPGDGRVLYHLGLLLAQCGRMEEAARLLAAAVERLPGEPTLRFQLGSVLAELGLRQEALAAFAAAVSFKPDFADAHFGKGNVLFQLGRMEEAVVSFARAESLAPERIEISLNLGSALLELGRTAEAVAAAERALKLAPDHPGALNHRGNGLRLLKRYEAALADFERVLVLHPDYVLARFNRATVLRELRRTDEALAECETVLKSAPGHAPAHSLKGTILLPLERPEEAVASFDQALALQPDLGEAYHGRISALIGAMRWEEALAATNAALARAPDSALVHNNRGVALLQLRRYGEAQAAFEAAIARDPLGAEAWFNRAGLMYQLGRLDDAFADTQKAFALRADFLPAQHFRFAMAAHLCDWSHRDEDSRAIAAHCREGRKVEVFPLLYAFDDPELHLAAARRYAGLAKQALTRTAVMARKKLRIAYISADFRDHPVTHQAIELFERHDRTRVETFGICLWPVPDTAMGARVRSAFDHFIECYDRADVDIARRLADLQIDIAIDLGGHTDKARPQVLAFRPAPVTATYIGYPGTLGGDYVDYIIADRWTIPPDCERHYAEHVVRLPLCFMPSDSTLQPSLRPVSRAEEGLPADGFVFANFNKSDKLTPEVFDIWMRLLTSVPGSVLWLNVQLQTARNNLVREAGSRGIDPARLVFAARTPSREDHLARLTLADLFIDTFPYNAHATTADFLYAGVPVLTVIGRTFASRVAASLLSKAGTEGLIASSLGEYEAQAIALANDPARLDDWRRIIAAHRHSEADTERLARAVEDAYFAMWDRRVRGLAPQGFDVS